MNLPTDNYATYLAAEESARKEARKGKGRNKAGYRPMFLRYDSGTSILLTKQTLTVFAQLLTETQNQGYGKDGVGCQLRFAVTRDSLTAQVLVAHGDIIAETVIFVGGDAEAHAMLQDVTTQPLIYASPAKADLTSNWVSQFLSVASLLFAPTWAALDLITEDPGAPPEAYLRVASGTLVETIPLSLVRDPDELGNYLDDVQDIFDLTRDSVQVNLDEVPREMKDVFHVDKHRPTAFLAKDKCGFLGRSGTTRRGLDIKHRLIWQCSEGFAGIGKDPATATTQVITKDMDEPRHYDPATLSNSSQRVLLALSELKLTNEEQDQVVAELGSAFGAGECF